MSRSRERDSAVPEAMALPPAAALEIRGLKAVNRILVDKVMELEKLVAELRKAGEENLENRGEGIQTEEPEPARSPEQEDVDRLQQPGSPVMFDLDPERPASSPTRSSLASIVPETFASPEPASIVPETFASSEPLPIVQLTPLPNYSPYLPPVDRTKQGEDFYADLQDKRIIPGYNDDRFSCWCHVAKSAEDRGTDVLSNAHSDSAAKESRGRRYLTFRWFAHASKCKFYQNPWATTGPGGEGKRLFPQFPLPAPSGEEIFTIVGERNQESAASDPARRKRSKVSKSKQVRAPDKDIEEPSKPVQDSQPRSSKRVEYVEDSEDGISAVGADSARPSMRRAVNPAPQGGFPLISNFEASMVVSSASASFPGSTSTVNSLGYMSSPLLHFKTPLPDYSPHLPPLDRTKQGEAFFADLRNKRIIPGYDEGRYSCWCHAAKNAQDPKPEVLSYSHSDVECSSRPYATRYKTTRWFTHASRCPFYKNPWATTGPDGTGERQFPQFPLLEPTGARMVEVVEQNDEEFQDFELPRGIKRRASADDEQDELMEEDGDQASEISQSPRRSKRGYRYR